MTLAEIDTGTTQLCCLAYRASPKSMLINGSSPTTPRVMPRRNRPHIARTKLCFGAVVHSDHYPPRDDVDEVANLATVCPNIRFDTLRPAPSRLMDHALDLDTTQVHDLDLALVKGSCFFRGISSFSPSLPRRTSNPIASDLAPSSCRNTSSFCFAPKYRARITPS